MYFNKKIFGFFCAVAAAVTFGLNPLFGLKLYENGLTPPTVLFYRFLFGSILLAIVMFCRKQSFVLPGKYLFWMITLALCLAGTSLGLFFSFKKMDASIASTILFVYPVIVALIMNIFFHEKITVAIIISIILSLAGVAVLCKTSEGAFINLPGLILALISALAYAIYMVLVKQTKLRELMPEQVTFYAMLFSLPFFLLTPGFAWKFDLFVKPVLLFNILGLAFFPAFLSFYLMAVGIQYIGATKTAILGALEPLTAVCIGVLVFHEAFTLRLALGIILVLSSVTLVVCSKNQKIKPQKKTLPRSDRNKAESKTVNPQ
ncbi:MAG: EamA family transporter [Lentisphaeria bacterium]|nr:EamA family transporter [Lentisphaeria bacterium]